MRRGSAPSQHKTIPTLGSNFRSPSMSRPCAPSQSSNLEQNQPIQDCPNSDMKMFNVVWCRASARKHKKYEDDALLIVRPQDRLAILKEQPSGKEIARGSGLSISELISLDIGGSISFGGKEVEIIDRIHSLPLKSAESPSLPVPETSSNASSSSVYFRPKVLDKGALKPFTAPSMFGISTTPPNVKSSSPLVSTSQVLDNSFILPRPPLALDVGNDHGLAHVIVDPHLAKQLRPHQKEGVIFLYKCVMGFNDSGCHGAILADEMGLGKTLQTITLIWTLLKQGPWQGKPVIKKTLILCPSSLTGNWQAEFKKWLGSERIQVYVVDSNNRVSEFIKRPHCPVLIMSYEMFVRSFTDLERLKFDLIVCDEGHRLKNDKVKASTLMSEMDTQRRIVLTGTPLQNDLKEFYSIVCAVNPNFLGTPQMFSRAFEDVIVKSKQPEATPEEKEDGELKMNELNKLTSQFILRRTQDIIKKFLPPKHEYVLFCRPSPLQTFLYERAIGGLGDWLSTLDSSCVLSRILQLRKICNHPSLCSDDPENIPPEFEELSLEEQGSKLALVSYILNGLRACGEEKVVLVSIYTHVLDLLQELCSHYGYPCARLDGSTPASQRQSIVNRFNARYGDEFVLLLSSKAGGTGLNLIGASRILLYDMDWNPAHDTQAMARVWRDGQIKPVTVYRLVTTGTIEEKIFQRQITKQGLGGGLMNESSKASQFHFTREELKDLFTFDSTLSDSCMTHNLLNCFCEGTGENVTSEQKPAIRECQLGGGAEVGGNSSVDMKDLLMWLHANPERVSFDDEHLEKAKGQLTYVMKNMQD